jgi:hypothetical protein
MWTSDEASRSDRARPSDSARLAAGLLIACMVVGWVAKKTAHADADEASLHAQVHFGLARVGDPVAGDETDTADFLGIGVRATYARSDWFAYELHATWNQLGRSALYDVPDQPLMIRRLSWARLDAGVTGRFGVEYIPTLHAAVGVQGRFGGEALIDVGPWAALADDAYATFDLVGSVGAGFDWRTPGEGDHWVLGGMVTVQRALLSTGPRFEAGAVLVHAAYYFSWFPGYD